MYRSSCYIIRDLTRTLASLEFQDSKDPITHIANGSIFIPSDHAEHHVLVASLSLQAEFMRVVVPSIDTRVYYTVRSILSIFFLCLYNKAQCEVKNTSEYILLPGTVKTYLNDKHVSSTEIHVRPKILPFQRSSDAPFPWLDART